MVQLTKKVYEVFFGAIGINEDWLWVKNVKWQKSSPKLVETFERIVPKIEAVENRKMFGYPCAFKSGNMFMGLHQENLFLRLSEEDRGEFLKLNQASWFEPMPGRIMKEYVVVPSWMLEDSEQMSKWVRKSLNYVSSLLPKVKKKRKTRAKLPIT